MFLGTDDLNLDAKGRLSMPARHRHFFEKDSDKFVVITCDDRGFLIIFQRDAWQRFLETKIEPEKDDWLQRTWLGNAIEVKLDATFRALVSPELRTEAKLTKEAKLIGMRDHLELWDKKSYDDARAKARAEREAKAAKAAAA